MMYFLKVNNLYDMFGQPDYKGLDLTKIIPGSQIYPKGEDFCYLATNESNIPENTDLEILTEEEYRSIHEQYINQIKQEHQIIEQRLIDLEIAMAAILGGAE